jgi:hypothetical protein
MRAYVVPTGTDLEGAVDWKDSRIAVTSDLVEYVNAALRDDLGQRRAGCRDYSATSREGAWRDAKARKARLKREREERQEQEKLAAERAAELEAAARKAAVDAAVAKLTVPSM